MRGIVPHPLTPPRSGLIPKTSSAPAHSGGQGMSSTAQMANSTDRLMHASALLFQYLDQPLHREGPLIRLVQYPRQLCPKAQVQLELQL